MPKAQLLDKRVRDNSKSGGKYFQNNILAGVHTTNRSYSSIARELNELGLMTFKGERFYPQTVKNMIGYLGIRQGTMKV